jgi:hypothetical protein
MRIVFAISALLDLDANARCAPSPAEAHYRINTLCHVVFFEAHDECGIEQVAVVTREERDTEPKLA